MILETVTVRNWRGYRAPRTFEFGPQLNLVVGPNEAGKSTLFEAVARALFDRHTSKAKQLRSIRSLGSSLGPEVVVTFSHDGRRYRVRKRFLHDPMAELARERKGEFVVDHEGDGADEHLRALLGGTEHRGATRPEHRGWSQALWYLQREAGIPEQAWSEALEKGLSGLVELALTTAAEDRVLTGAQAAYREYWTATGRLSRRSEAFRVAEEIPALEAELARVTSEAERVATLRAQLIETEEHLEKLGTRQVGFEQKIAALEERMTAVKTLEQTRVEQERALEVAVERADRANSVLAAVRQRRERAAQLEARLAESRLREAELSGEVRQFRREAEGHARRQEKDLQPKLERLEAKLAELRSRLRLERLERERERLEGVVRKLTELEAQRAALRAKIESRPLPDERVWNRFVVSNRERENLEARLEGGAVRVRFEQLPGESLAVEPETRRSADGSYLVTEATRFVLGGGRRVEVTPSHGDLERWRTMLARERDHCQEVLDVFEASDFDELAARHTEVTGWKAALSGVDGRLAGLGDEDPVARLEAVEREQQEIQASASQAVLPGIEGWAREHTAEEIAAGEREHEDLRTRLQRARDAEHQAQQECLTRSEALRDATGTMVAARSELEALEEQNGRDLESWGTLEALAGAASRATAEVTRVRTDHQALVERWEREIAGPRRRVASLQRELEATEALVRRLETDATDRRARIQSAAEMGVFGRLDELEHRLAAHRDRHATVSRRADAARLLYDQLERRRRERSRAVTAPVSERVDAWLRQLTGERYKALVLDDKLLPVGVTGDGDDDALPLSSLSYGTHEQVAVLLRLAIAVLLSSEERQLVVLDDRLVNADHERMRRLCGVIEQAAESCQVVLATCRPEAYEDLTSCHRIGIDAVDSFSAEAQSGEGQSGEGQSQQVGSEARGPTVGSSN